MCVCVCVADFQVELQLDSQKHQQKGGVRRALFLDSHQASLLRSLRMRRGERSCHDAKIYLRVRRMKSRPLRKISALFFSSSKLDRSA